MDESLRIAMIGVAAPALAAGAGTLSALLLVREHVRPAPVEARSFAGAIAATVAGLALCVGIIGVRGSAAAGWNTMDHRLLIAAGIMAVASLALVVRGRGGVRWFVIWTALVSALAAGVVVGRGLWTGSAGTLRDFSQALGPAAWAVPALTLLGAGVWAGLACWSMSRTSDASPRVAAPLLLLGVSIAVAAGLLGTGSVKLGQFGFALAATVAGAGVATMLVRKAVFPRAIIACASVGLSTLMVAGVVFSSTPLWVWALLAGAPLSGALADALLIRGDRPWRRATLRIGVAAVVAGVAVAPGIIELARLASGGANDDPYGDVSR